MKLGYETNAWGGLFGHPAGVTSVKDLYYLVNGSTEAALVDIAAAGYTGCEVFDGNLMQYLGRESEMQDLMARLNLSLVAVYSGGNFIYPDILDDELSRIETAAKLAVRFNATHLVVGGGAVRARGIQESDYRLLGEGLEKVVALANEYGLVASYHPHLGTCVVTPDQIAKAFEYTGINFCPDTAHQYAGGGDPAALIRKYGDRIKYVHLKDFDGSGFMPLGEGKLDFPDILSALKAMQYDGWITMELDGYPGPAKEAAQRSREYLEAWERANG